MMVAAVSEVVSSNNSSRSPKTTPINDNPRRPPLLPSEKDNGINPKKPKARQVSSRYMSPSPSTSSSSVSTSSSRRCPSPLVSRNSTNSLSSPSVLPKRSVSVDRRRPFRPDLESKVGNVGEVSAATKLLVTSTRSLSVSFQGEAFSLPISKTKVAPASPNLSSVRKGTPERRRTSTPTKGKVDGGGDQVENSKPTDQHRWPGRSRQTNSLTRSVDCSSDINSKLIGSGNVIRALQQSMNGESRRASFDGRLSLDLGNTEVMKSVEQTPDGKLLSFPSVSSDLTASDTDSVSSGSTSGVQECNGVPLRHNGPRGIVVSARFWQETNSRLRRLQDSGSPLATSPGSKMGFSPKYIQSKKFQCDSSISSPRTMASPNRGGTRPASPSKFTPLMASSPIRGMISPSRARHSVSSTINCHFSETPSVLSFAVDIRRGKVGENRLVEAHLLRLLYNRQLQWRFVNARTEATLLVQRRNAEKNLWNAWITISDLRDSVTKRRHRLQLLKQKLKLAAILKEQIAFLEDWASLDKNHSVSLLGAIEALKASTLRLPVVGAIADIQNMKEAVSSALDVMQAMGSSICSLLLKVEEMHTLVAELAQVCEKERSVLEQCKDFLSVLAAMQVKYCSLRTHILQHNHVPTT
ncbi:QWRF motif-containing protein 2-like [Apium graveolens]|uniref:QWRF motif-containing protein 2-like n=1 Tax=Apium graveolens TaxID=4045 RepID=UPI003D7B3639